MSSSVIKTSISKTSAGKTSISKRVGDSLSKVCATASLSKKYQEILDRTIPQSDERYLQIVYDKIGELHDHPTNKKDVARDILKKRYGFESHAFAEITKKKKLDNARVINPPQLQKGGMKCKKCGKTNTWFYELQTRGGDEPMTIFILCGNVDCKAMYRY